MIRRWGLIALLAAGILCSAHAWVLRSMANYLDVSAPQFPSDYVVVLPGDQNTRTFAAVVILQEGLADRIAILKNPDDNAVDEGRRLPSHVLTERIVTARGVPASRIDFLEGESRTTFTDVQLLSKIWQTHPQATITLVTNRYHTRRARWTVRHQLGSDAAKVSIVGVSSDAFYWDRWWTSEAGFQLIVAEYLKLGFYAVRYSTMSQRLFALAICASVVAVSWRRRHRRRALINAAGES